MKNSRKKQLNNKDRVFDDGGGGWVHELTFLKQEV